MLAGNQKLDKAAHSQAVINKLDLAVLNAPKQEVTATTATWLMPLTGESPERVSP